MLRPSISASNSPVRDTGFWRFSLSTAPPVSPPVGLTQRAPARRWRTLARADERGDSCRQLAAPDLPRRRAWKRVHRDDPPRQRGLGERVAEKAAQVDVATPVAHDDGGHDLLAREPVR